jgi:hypothetical protein
MADDDEPKPPSRPSAGCQTSCWTLFAAALVGVALAFWVAQMNAPGWLAPVAFFGPVAVVFVLVAALNLPRIIRMAREAARNAPSPESVAAGARGEGVEVGAKPETSGPVSDDTPTVPAVATVPGKVLAHSLDRAGLPRGCEFGCALVFATIWNGIVSVFVWKLVAGWNQVGRFKWFNAAFLVPFVLVGLVLIGYVLHAAYKWFVSWFVGRVEVEVSAHPLAPGGAVRVHVSQRGAVRLGRVTVWLVCTEQASYIAGTSKSTATKEVAKHPVNDPDAHPDERRLPLEVEFTVPEDAMHSFEAPNNEIKWTVRVTGRVMGLPFSDDYSVAVAPDSEVRDQRTEDRRQRTESIRCSDFCPLCSVLCPLLRSSHDRPRHPPRTRGERVPARRRTGRRVRHCRRAAARHAGRRVLRTVAHVRQGERGHRRGLLPGVEAGRRDARGAAEPAHVRGAAAADAVELRWRADQDPLARAGARAVRRTGPHARSGPRRRVHPRTGGTSMTRVGVRPRVNPFSTRFVQPGAIAFRFPTPDGLAALARRLEEHEGWGEIVGPHGSGKSTLLAALLPVLARWHVRSVRLNTSQRELPAWVWEVPIPQSLLVIDGFEQLGFYARWRVKRYCRRSGSGLLVTAHRSMGLPELYRTDVTPETARDVIATLLPPGGAWVLDGFDIAARLRHYHGSFRDVLFELYDRWQSCRGASGSPA